MSDVYLYTIAAMALIASAHLRRGASVAAFTVGVVALHLTNLASYLFGA